MSAVSVTENVVVPPHCFGAVVRSPPTLRHVHFARRRSSIVMVQKNEMPFRTLLNMPVVLVTAWTACELCNTKGGWGQPLPLRGNRGDRRRDRRLHSFALEAHSSYMRVDTNHQSHMATTHLDTGSKSMSVCYDLGPIKAGKTAKFHLQGEHLLAGAPFSDHDMMQPESLSVSVHADQPMGVSLHHDCDGLVPIATGKWNQLMGGAELNSGY